MIEHGRAVKACRGFTLIEMIVAMAILALLLTIAVPRYFSSLDRSKDAVLMENLKVTRDVIDKFYADTGRYPDSLGELVDKRYLRQLPLDPVTQSSNTWIIVPPEAPIRGQVYDLHSGARGRTSEGRPYGSL